MLNFSFRLTPDGRLYAADLVMAITGKHRQHANEVLRELGDDYFEQSNYGHFKRQKVLTLSHAIQLVMVLPVKEAAAARSKMFDIIESACPPGTLDGLFWRAIGNPVISA